MTSMTFDLFFTVAASASLFSLLIASAFVLPWSEDEFSEVERDWAELWSKLRGYSLASALKIGGNRGRRLLG